MINGIHGKNVLSSLPVGKGFLFVLLYYYFFCNKKTQEIFAQRHRKCFSSPTFGIMSELAKVEDKYFRTLQ